MTDRIIPLELFRNARPARPLSDRGSAILCGLEAYWRSLPADAGVPQRRALEARTLGDALPHAFIAERIAPGLARIRVAGRKLGELLGVEPRGMPLSVFFDPSMRNDLARHVENAFSQPAIVALPVMAPAKLRRPKLNGQLLLLPLRSVDGPVDQVLGALVLDGELGMAPRRLLIAENAEIRCDRLYSDRNLSRLFETRHDAKPGEDNAAPDAKPNDQPEPQPEAQVAAAAPAQPTQRPKHRHLRLLVDNDRR